ncbi:NAD(P)-binding protein [Ganoderma leucocontextum]|nr:NAD(P)-binding protein [Ganoderma leucocontextum]
MSTALSLMYALCSPHILFSPSDSIPWHASDIPNLSGKVALITGGTQGKGFEIAKAFAYARARVLILARDGDRPDIALLQIKRHCRVHEKFVPDVKFVECDLASLSDVRRVGDQLCEQESRLDMVVCDAGVGIQAFDVSADGIDRHFAVTHLAHFLLINRLLPLLRRSALTDPPSSSPSTSPSHSRTSTRPRAPRAPRIVCLTSTLHSVSSRAVQFISNAELSYESGSAQSPLALYARAKLATVLFVKALVRHLDHDILALAVDPGAVHPGQSNQLLKAYGPLWGSALRAMTGPFERSVGEACLTALWAATALRADQGEEEWERWQGAYVSAVGVAGGEGELARDEGREAQLWRMSEALVRRRLGNDALRPWSG